MDKKMEVIKFRRENLQNQIVYYKNNYGEDERREAVTLLQDRLNSVLKIASECGL